MDSRKILKRPIDSILGTEQKAQKRYSGGFNDEDIIGIANPNSCVSGSSILDAEDILLEILSRLPGKSLMRFKCVCKRWEYLIQRDEQFHDLHLTRSNTHPRLLILIRPLKHGDDYDPPPLNTHCFVSLDLLSQGRPATGIDNMRNWNYFVVMKPVNGLICSIDLRMLDVRMYNHCTRETTTPVALTYKEGNRWLGTCGFGFDPATKEHKMIFLWIISTSFASHDHYLCEILTLGHKSWRRIDAVPPYTLKGSSVYANGSIYWRNFESLKDKICNDDPAAIVAFDVGREKFRVIPLPTFILDQTPNTDAVFSRLVHLLEVDGRVALLHRVSGDTVKLWIVDDGYDMENKTTTTTSGGGGSSTSNRNWIEETITLRSCWDKNIYFHGVAGTDQLILESYSDSSKHRKYVSLYSYNRKKKTFTKLEIKDIPSIPDDCYIPFCTTFVESLLPV